MSTATAPMQSQAPSWRSRIRGKYVIFAVLAVMAVIVLFKNESFLWTPDHPIWAHYGKFKWSLLAHGGMGALALFLGPLQFSDRLRQRNLKLHRISGRLYIAGVLVAAPYGFYIQYIQGPTLFNAAAAVQAFNWIATTAIALYYVRSGNIQAHRQWMTRSFAVAVIFLEVRVILAFLPAPPSLETIMLVVWLCNGFALLKADIILSLEEMLRKRSVPRPAMKAAAHA